VLGQMMAARQPNFEHDRAPTSPPEPVVGESGVRVGANDAGSVMVQRLSATALRREVQQSSTATPSSPTGLPCPRSHRSVLREAQATAMPRVRNEGVRGSSPLSSTDETAGQRPSPVPG
jgi:hypothetical protein